MPDYAADDVHMKLVNKISNQAVQLGDLNKALCGSAEYIERCESKIRELETAASLSSKLSDQQAQSNMDDAVRSQAESRKIISQLEEDLQSKCRQCSISEKKLLELRTEMQKVKLQLRTSQHGLRFASRPTNVIEKSNQIQQPATSGSRIEIESLQKLIKKCECQLEEAKVTERTMTLKISVLEETIEQHSKYAGAKGHTEVLAKVTNQRRQIRKLKSELATKTLEIAGATAALTGNPSPIKNKSNESSYEKGISFLDDSWSSSDSSISSHEEKVLALEQIISSLQKKFLEAERELKRFKSDEMATQYQVIQEERNTLLDYIQGDMVKSTEINYRLRKCEAELSNSIQALAEESERADKFENSYHSELARAITLAVDLSTSQKTIATIEQKYNADNIGKSEEAKKGAYIINVLTSELKLSRNRICELEKLLDNLKKSYDSPQASLSLPLSLPSGQHHQSAATGAGTRPGPHVDISSTSGCRTQTQNGNENRNGNGDGNITSMSVHNLESNILSNGTDTTVYCGTVVAALGDNSSHNEESLRSKREEHELLILRKERIEWQYERVALQRKVDQSSLLDQALIELTRDLNALHNGGKSSKPIPRDVDSNQIPTLPLPLPLFDPPFSAGNPSNHMDDSSYSSTYSRMRRTQIPSYMGSTSARSPPRNHRGNSLSQKSLPLSDQPEKIVIKSNKTVEEEKFHLCPMSEYHYKLINLPSLLCISTILHEHINKIINDLYNAELKYREQEGKLKSLQSTIDNLRECHKDEILNYIAAAEVHDRNTNRIKNDLEISEKELKTESQALKILDKIILAFLSAPEGYEMFSDSTLQSEENILNSSSDDLLNSNFHGIQSTEKLSGRIPCQESQLRQFYSSGDSPSPGPRKSLIIGRTPAYDNHTNSSTNHGDITKEIRKQENFVESVCKPIEVSVVKDSICRIPIESLPEMVIRAVMIATSAINKLKVNDDKLLKSSADLQKLQSIYRISKGECEYLFKQIEEIKINNNKMKHSYSDMERSLKNDLETATDLVEKQNSLIIDSEAKIQNLVREKYLISAQLTSTIQRESDGSKKILNVLKEYVLIAGINPSRIPLSITKGMAAITVFLKEILSKLVHTQVIRSVSSNRPLGLMDESTQKKKKNELLTPESKVRTSAIVGYQGGWERRGAKLGEGRKEEGKEKEIEIEIEVAELSKACTSPNPRHSVKDEDEDGDEDEDEYSDDGRRTGSKSTVTHPQIKSIQKKSSPVHSYFSSSYPIAASQVIQSDSTSINANSLAQFTDKHAGSNSTYSSHTMNGTCTNHLLYGYEDPRTINLHSSNDFIKHLKARNRAVNEA